MKATKFITSTVLAITLLGSSAMLTNCKKDEKDPEPTPAPAPAPVPETNTQKLTGKNFKMTALTVDPAVFGITNIYAQLNDCEKDNFFRFDSPNIYKEDEGGTKCNPTDNQTTTGSWTWNTTETILTITTGTDVASYNVATNDGTTLKLTNTESDGTINYVFTTTFVKQ